MKERERERKRERDKERGREKGRGDVREGGGGCRKNLASGVCAGASHEGLTHRMKKGEHVPLKCLF